MLCLYINLAGATNRKAHIEKSFSSFNFSTNLQRFEAINVNDVLKKGVAGNLTEIEKACFLSHATLIKSMINSKNNLFVMEDDIEFYNDTFSIINQTINAMSEIDWDILYTDVCIPEPTTMIDLIKIKNELKDTQSFRILDLKKIHFAGATGYIINKKSILKLSNLIEEEKKLDVPFDLLLRNLIYNNDLKGFSIFPFVTTLSDDSFNSQIQPKNSLNTDFVWNVFRKLIWANSIKTDTDLLIRKMQNEFCDEESMALATVIASCISKKFSIK